MAKLPDVFIGPDGQEWVNDPNVQYVDAQVNQNGAVLCTNCGHHWFWIKAMIESDPSEILAVDVTPDSGSLVCAECRVPLTLKTRLQVVQ